jgi:hypothetical protein
VVSFPQVSPLKPCMHLSSPPYVPHVPPISVFMTWSPEWYLVRSTEHKARRYAVFSIPLLPRPFLGPNILLSTLFSKTLSRHSSLNISDQVSHPYKTTGKIIVLYILIFTFLDNKLELSSPSVVEMSENDTLTFHPRRPTLCPHTLGTECPVTRRCIT